LEGNVIYSPDILYHSSPHLIANTSEGRANDEVGV